MLKRDIKEIKKKNKKILEMKTTLSEDKKKKKQNWMGLVAHSHHKRKG